MHGHAREDMKKMNHEMFKKGGAFDQFAGEDGALQFDEAKKMNDVIRKALSK